MIEFRCKNCGQKLSVQDQYSGKRVKCPKCGSVGVVPDSLPKIKFNCQDCGQSISVPQIHAGKKGKCPKCKNMVVVPSLKREPADGAGTFSVVCLMCNEAIQVPETSRGQTIECPECGSYIETSSGGAPGESDASADEDRYEEEDEEYEDSEGVDRHLIVVISSVAAVVVVGLIILAVVLPFVLRFSRSRSARRPEDLQAQQQVVDTDSRPQPVTPDTQPTEPVVQEPPQKDALTEEPIVQEPPPSVVRPRSPSEKEIERLIEMQSRREINERSPFVPRRPLVVQRRSRNISIRVLLWIVFTAISSLIMAVFVRLSTKLLFRYDIPYGEAYKIAFLVAVIPFLIRLVTAYINEPTFYPHLW
jgi:DNA-directed RNA polymerase subunit RPC12/RpoP